MTTKKTKKATKKVASKKSARGRKFADKSAPKFDPRKHVKLSALAKECRISYQSMFLKQERMGIRAINTNLDGIEVKAFTKADADKILELKAEPMRKDSVPLQDLESELKVSRPKLTNIMLKNRIVPVKRQGENNRQTLTVTSSEADKIRQAVKA